MGVQIAKRRESRSLVGTTIILFGVANFFLRSFYSKVTGSTYALAAPFSAEKTDFTQLAAVLRDAVVEQRLQQLETLVREVQSSGVAGLVGQRRNFGEHTGRATGHEVTYLHQHASETLLDWLWDLGLAAAAKLPSWGLSEKYRGLRRPGLRCLEFIEYYPQNREAELAGKQEAAEGLCDLHSALSWHHDGATVCTMIMALSTAGQHFDGGELQVRDRRGGKAFVHTVGDLRRGDIAAWRGWDLHRVCPVHRGRRQVIVAEWWPGPSCSVEDSRPLDSEDVVRQVLQLDASNPQLHVLLGQALLEKRDVVGAENSCRAAIQFDPLHVEAHHGLAWICKLRGDRAGAEAGFRATLELDPKQAKAHYNLGQCLREKGDAVGAEESFRAVIRLDPLAAEAHLALANTLSMRGDSTGAEKSYQAAVQLNPQLVQAHTDLSMRTGALPWARPLGAPPGMMLGQVPKVPAGIVVGMPARMPPGASPRMPPGAPPAWRWGRLQQTSSSSSCCDSSLDCHGES